jgi:regulator of protease activity HflC (stomatin/prohibitin superfamily)
MSAEEGTNIVFSIGSFVPIFIIVICILKTAIFSVRQQTVAIIERFGKFHKTKSAGLRIKAPFGIDRIVSRTELRIQQANLQIEQKTKDNVFVEVDVAVQYRVNEQNIEASFYKLSQPEWQIQSYVEDALRSTLPKYTLDEAYEKKDEIAQDVFDTVSAEMNEYGYIIVKTLITSMEPDALVKTSMNEINSAQRQRAAAQELAEADRIKVVTAARAQAERDQLHGEGIANERRAIVDGLAKSFEELKDAGLTEAEIMSVLLTEQYLDAISEFARNQNNTTIFLPATANGAADIREQILSSFAALQDDKLIGGMGAGRPKIKKPAAQ